MARREGADIVAIIRDDGASGPKARQSSSYLTQVLATKGSGVDAVVVVRTDRLSRDAAGTLRQLQRRGGPLGFISIAEHMNMLTVPGYATAEVAAVFDELEHERALQTVESLRRLREQRRPWNHPPFGWRVEDDRLVPETDELETLAREPRFVEAAKATGR